MSKVEIGRGAIFVYLENILSMLLGYIFWLLLSRLATPDAIGSAAAVISLATIFSTIGSIGIPTGIQRFLGVSFSNKNFEEAKMYVLSGLVLSSLGVLLASIFVFFSQAFLDPAFRLIPSLVTLGVILTSVMTFMVFVRAIVLSSLKTKKLPLVMIISNIAKISAAVILVVLGFGATGIVIGFILFPAISCIVLGLDILTVLKGFPTRPKTKVWKPVRDIISASIVTWIPTSIYTLGAHLGPLLVFGSHGPEEAGVYFIAFSLVIAISAATSALFTIAYPKLSAMTDGRKRLTARAIKISLIVTMPFSSYLLFNSTEVMAFFGPGYAQGSFPLQLLLLSVFPATLTQGINTLSYSYGNYRQVMTIGLASNVPRAVLYLVLVPSFDGIGASVGYTVGAVIGLLFSLHIAKSLGLLVNGKQVGIIVLVPTLLAFSLSLMNLNFFASLVVVLIVSYTVYLKLRILDNNDLQDTYEILPKNLAHPLHFLWTSFSRIIRRGI